MLSDLDTFCKCETIGGLFKLSGRDGLDSEKFITKVLTDDDIGLNILSNMDSYEWCGDTFMYSGLMYGYEFEKGFTFSEYELWFMGYLYEHWIITRGALPRDIYRLLTPRRFYHNFSYFHTQDWDVVIDTAIEMTEQDRWQDFELPGINRDESER